MDPLIYDVQKHEFVGEDPLGLSGYISWRRLADLIQEHEALPGETVAYLVIRDKHGIDIRYR